MTDEFRLASHPLCKAPFFPNGKIMSPGSFLWMKLTVRNGVKRSLMNMSQRPEDEDLLRKSFDVARRARDNGDHPFGSILTDKSGAVLMEQGNGYSSEGGDRTAHAERILASRAAKAYGVEFLADCTLYTSAEPCAMCAGAIYWAGIGRVVYGQTEKDLKAQTGAHEENPTLDLPCHIVFEAGQRTTEIVGPLLESEAAKLQEDFWAARKE
jgi:tRNA(Arg) A34 adenosine deaminase TadA